MYFSTVEYHYVLQTDIVVIYLPRSHSHYDDYNSTKAEISLVGGSASISNRHVEVLSAENIAVSAALAAIAGLALLFSEKGINSHWYLNCNAKATFHEF